MTISLEIRVGHLLAKFLANALVFLAPLQTAGAITAGALEALFHHVDHFLIFVQPYSHGSTSLLFLNYTDSLAPVKRKRNISHLHLTNKIGCARILWQSNEYSLIRSDTQEAEGAPLLRE